ncbi:hypothetical protein [Kineosporia sp. A_224]|uniref:hypothetical protein n=1 Tax=Kineosporia sp. A_224 TaxID=1962180 RepID=UPI000B4AFB64|nr:hypothetical protein [Kineosporia sp. A_224]
MLAHAFGERYDSPVPLSLFVLGGALVVLLSFALVYRREVAPDDTVRADVVVPPSGGRVLPALSVVVLALLVLGGLLGSQEVSENLLPVFFWLVVWVALPLAVGAVGDFTGPVNPFAAIARAAGSARVRKAVLNRTAPLPWPPALGWWLAAGVYFVVVVGELVLNATATLPRVTATGLVVYALVCAVGGIVFGADAWNGRGEMFTVLFATWGRLGWWRFRAGGRRGFAGGLDVPFEASASRVVAVLLLLVSVSFDGLLSTPQWGTFTAAFPAGVAPGSAGYEVFATGTFAVLTAVTLGVFGAFAVAAGRAGAHGSTSGGTTTLPAFTGLLPSLLPIAYGYLLAHYLQYVVVNGQLLLPLLGNPVGSDTWPLSLPYPFNDDYVVSTALLPTAVVWYVQIVVIVVAHVVAVVLAHRHLGRAASTVALARRSEWPWLAAMVGYTMLSLWLLAQPLVEHSGGSA